MHIFFEYFLKKPNLPRRETECQGMLLLLPLSLRLNQVEPKFGKQHLGRERKGMNESRRDKTMKTR